MTTEGFPNWMTSINNALADVIQHAVYSGRSLVERRKALTDGGDLPLDSSKAFVDRVEARVQVDRVTISSSETLADDTGSCICSHRALIESFDALVDGIKALVERYSMRLEDFQSASHIRSHIVTYRAYNTGELRRELPVNEYATFKLVRGLITGKLTAPSIVTVSFYVSHPSAVGSWEDVE